MAMQMVAVSVLRLFEYVSELRAWGAREKMVRLLREAQGGSPFAPTTTQTTTPTRLKN